MSSRISRPALLIVTLACTVLSGVACSSGSGSSKPKTTPAGSILSQAATAMRGVTSVGFALATEGSPPVKVKSANGRLLKSGDATGTVQVTELGLLVNLKLVILGDTVYVKGLTGGWQKMSRQSVASIYDPTAVLDPNRGVAPMLSTATNGTTDGRQTVAGHDCDHVNATLSATAVKTLVPGESQSLPAQLWIDHSSHLLIKVSVPVPPAKGGKPGTVIVTLSDFNVPFTVTAPA